MSCDAKVVPSSHAEIPDRHEFQFEFLVNRPVTSAIPRKSSGGLALEFTLADIADIRTDHEAKQMFGINALRARAGRQQREAQDGRPERFGELAFTFRGPG